MKLLNAIVIYDVFVVTGDDDSNAEAVDTVKSWIADGSLAPSESKAMEVRDARNIRQSWRDQKPLVGASVSDHDFEKHVKGHTTLDVFEHIYTKRG